MQKFFLTLLLFIAFNINSYSGLIHLVQNGKSEYSIVIPSVATTTEKYAAKELQMYINRISNCNIPIVTDKFVEKNKEILIGKTSRQESVKDTYYDERIVVKTVNEKLVLNGGVGRSVLYSVYSFLENYLGCKRYTKDVGYIPRSRSISLSNINYLELPSFSFRSIFSQDVYYDTTFADWNKLNYFFENRGYFDDKGSYVHTFEKLLPSSEFFVRFPEYYALVNGKRNPSQLCLSNNEVYKIVVNRLQQEMKKKPYANVWSVSPNDNTLFCQCKLCKPMHDKGNGYMETLLPFVNRIARKFPDKVISTLAYNQSFNPSKFVRPEKNVEIMVCITKNNKLYSIDFEQSDENKRVKDVIYNWRRQTDNIFIWDYIANYVNTNSPYPNFSSMISNIKYYKSINIDKVFLEGLGHQTGEFSELKTYLASKILWNSSINQESVIDEFLDAYYEEASAYIKSYLIELEKDAKKSNIVLTPLDYVAYRSVSFLNWNNINKYKRIFNDAEKKLSAKPNILKRVIKERLSLDFAEIEMALLDTQYRNKIGGDRIIKQKAIKFYDEAKNVGIKYVSNGGVSIEDYLKSITSAPMRH